jgi:O-antigen/teichoic acid export membrane protein
VKRIFQIAYSLIKEPIITGSFWVTAGGLIISFGSYLFNLLMGRLLIPSDYGTLISLVSLSIIISIPSSVLLTITTKFTASFYAKNEYKKISRLLQILTRYTFIASLLIVIIFVSFSEYFASFFNIDNPYLIILTGLLIGVSLLTSINQGAYRGLLFFSKLTIWGISIMVLKLLLGWLLVGQYLVSGALLAVVLSNVLCWAFSFIPLEKYFKEKTIERYGLTTKIISFSVPTFLFTTSTTLFLYADLLIVKHFFSSENAGLFAAASLVGKAIFYAVSPVAIVLFPLISQSHASGNSIKKELALSMLLTAGFGTFALLIYIFQPSLVLSIFFPGQEYINAQNLIVLYGAYMLLYSLVYLLVQLFLALEDTIVSYVCLIGALLQIVLISLFHDNLQQVITISISVLICLLIAMTIRLFFLKKFIFKYVQ